MAAVGRAFPLSDYPAALARLSREELLGKIVLRHD